MDELIAIDDPARHVRRLTLNRPDKRNAINNALRGELFAALEAGDADPDVHVVILRGAGTCFSSGYDLKSDLGADRPYYTSSPAAGGGWQRQVTAGWLSIWDLGVPVIAQIHGYAMAGASELAAACDLVYMADDATISHPVVRLAGTPDFAFHPWLVGMRNAMEMVLTGDAIDAAEAVRMGYANRSFPADELDDRVLALAERIASVPGPLSALNKRTVHHAMEVMGARAAIRSVPDMAAVVAHIDEIREALAGGDLTGAVKAAARRDPAGE